MTQLNTNDWLIKVEHDLESAQILIQQTANYDIVVYHSHQTIEKLLKWFLLVNDIKFPFVHDLILLSELCQPQLKTHILLDDIAYVNKLLPKTRYPLGDWILEEEAIQSLMIAEDIYRKLIIYKNS